MNILTSITGVFDVISEWIIGAIPGVTALFYDASTGLTLLGTLGVASLAFSVCFQPSLSTQALIQFSKKTVSKKLDTFFLGINACVLPSCWYFPKISQIWCIKL